MQSILGSIEANPDPENVMKLVRAALGSPDIFGFAELYDHESVQALQESGDALELKVYSALKLFCFLNWRDYSENSEAYPELSQEEQFKLKQLTLVHLASTCKTLPYDVVEREIGLDALEVESLILRSIYSGILTAKISQASHQIQIDWCIGRDVDADGLAHITAVLKAWKKKSQLMIKSLNGQVDKARTKKDLHDAAYKHYKDTLDEMLSVARAKMLEQEDDGGLRPMKKGGLGGRRNKRGRGKATGKRGHDDDLTFF